jgi:tetratricopeptide (TPR) repeat protein
MRSQRQALCLLLVALAAPAMAWAAREGRLIGKVVDPQGQPIAGVTVTATSKQIEGFEKVLSTDAKGIFILDFDRINVTYQYRFEKAGYLTSTVDQTWTLRDTERHEFKLQPGDTPALGDRPPASTSNPAIAAFNQGVGAFDARDYATAAARFEEALRHDPALRQAWSALSLAHLEQKHYQRAAEAAEKAVGLGATEQSVFRARWEAYRNLGDEERTRQARAALDQAGRMEEEAKRIHNEGVALSKRGDDHAAFVRFQQAVEIDPNLQQAWLAVAVTGLKIGQPVDAVAAAKRVLETHPGHPEALRIQY